MRWLRGTATRVPSLFGLMVAAYLAALEGIRRDSTSRPRDMTGGLDGAEGVRSGSASRWENERS